MEPFHTIPKHGNIMGIGFITELSSNRATIENERGSVEILPRETFKDSSTNLKKLFKLQGRVVYKGMKMQPSGFTQSVYVATYVLRIEDCFSGLANVTSLERTFGHLYSKQREKIFFVPMAFGDTSCDPYFRTMGDCRTFFRIGDTMSYIAAPQTNHMYYAFHIELELNHDISKPLVGIVVDFDMDGNCDLWVKRFGFVRIYPEDLDWRFYESTVVKLKNILQVGDRLTFRFNQNGENQVTDVKLIEQEALDKLKKIIGSLGAKDLTKSQEKKIAERQKSRRSTLEDPIAKKSEENKNEDSTYFAFKPPGMNSSPKNENDTSPIKNDDVEVIIPKNGTAKPVKSDDDFVFSDLDETMLDLDTNANNSKIDENCKNESTAKKNDCETGQDIETNQSQATRSFFKSRSSKFVKSETYKPDDEDDVKIISNDQHQNIMIVSNAEPISSMQPFPLFSANPVQQTDPQNFAFNNYPQHQMFSTTMAFQNSLFSNHLQQNLPNALPIIGNPGELTISTSSSPFANSISNLAINQPKNSNTLSTNSHQQSASPDDTSSSHESSAISLVNTGVQTEPGFEKFFIDELMNDPETMMFLATRKPNLMCQWISHSKR